MQLNKRYFNSTLIRSNIKPPRLNSTKSTTEQLDNFTIKPNTPPKYNEYKIGIQFKTKNKMIRFFIKISTPTKSILF